MPNIQIVDTELPNVIEFKDISMVYLTKKGPKVVIEGLNLLVEDIPNQGQFIVILGKSGCGKSTILRFVADIQHPTSGEVLINGKSRSEYGNVPMVFQDYSSFPWRTVLENVMLPLEYLNVPKKERIERAMAMIKLVGLEGHEDKYAKSPGLSGGQLQRVAIARCLIVRPQILLMDEPFGALDTSTRNQMQLLAAKIWEQMECTFIFVTHDISEAVFLADDIYVMSSNPGMIVKHFPVALGFHRDRNTKRDPKFIDLVSEIDDYMNAL